MAALAMWAGLLAGCGDGTGPVEPIPDSLAVEVVASGLSNPLYLASPAGDARLFVVEQPGRIRIIQNGSLLTTSFLDITGRVLDGGERGLLSVAFHPSYASNRFLYVNYTDNQGDTRVERYTATSDPNVADPNSALLIIGIAQPFANHNGGLVMFGPDGMLYIGMGDGGSGGDPQGHGQNRATLLGDLLRIDVNQGSPYAVPADNPFVNQTGMRGEIWGYGLRNPWRFSFDPEGGTLYIADVGQNAWEEVNAVLATAKGVNYGWNILEASACYGSATCDRSGLTLPVLEYAHDGGACSVTGGFVYRGQRIAGLQGHYFYSDFCAGWLRSFHLVDGRAEEQREWDVGDLGQVMSFGEDAARELYILSANGRVYRLISGTQ
jgi:glucose/arabinose dehydrogenase